MDVVNERIIAAFGHFLEGRLPPRSRRSLGWSDHDRVVEDAKFHFIAPGSQPRWLYLTQSRFS